MSESESFGSAKDDDNFDASDASKDESEDEPLSKKKKTKKTTPKKLKSAKKNGKKEKKVKTKRGRPKKTKVSSAPDPLEDTSDKSEEEYEVQAIVGHRQYNGKLVYKIRWKGYDPVHDTWENHDSLSCPDLLEMYNAKHNIEIPKKKSKSIKRKRGRPKGSQKTPKKRRNSVSDENSDTEDWDGDGGLSDGKEDDEEYEVDKIVELRKRKDGTREFRVHWKRWSSDYDTWEPEANLSCPEKIEAFLQRVEEAKTSNVKELRTERKHTERFTLNTNDSGRRLSKRHNAKQRVQYFDTEADDE